MFEDLITSDRSLEFNGWFIEAAYDESSKVYDLYGCFMTMSLYCGGWEI